jgi:SAM-dependent methyltransferase
METVACDVCGASQEILVFQKSMDDVRYRIVQCAACGLVYVNPRHFEAEADGYFEGPYLDTIEENGKLRPGIELIYSEVIGYINAYLYPGRLLDVGCAMGHFMKFVRGYGWEPVGTECSGYAARWARERYFVEAHQQCALNQARFPPEYCDAAVLIEVIEHLPAPRQTMAEVFRILKPGGVVCVTTPNFACFRSLLLREEWAPVIPSGHLYYFTRQSLERLLRSTGFVDVVELTKPGDLEEDLKFAQASGKLRIDAAALKEIRARLLVEDAPKVSNGRGEGLILCAQKPPGPGLAARRKGLASVQALDGKLVQATTENKVFYVSGGVKRWVMSRDWAVRRGLRLPEDVLSVPPQQLFGLPEGFPVGN